MRFHLPLGHISGLTDLYLYNNGLTGDIPAALGNLVALRNLDLSANDLSGGVPSSFGNLEVLLSLKLSNNADLTGPLPSGLINTSLNILLADGTNLCAPRDQQFLNWLLVVHNRSIPICQLSMEDRETLVAFYNATDGPNWTGISTNWLSNRPIDEWRGVVVDSTGRVSHLILGSVGVSGALPSSLGNLSNLQQLYLARNQLSGNIPTELGNLANLRNLFLHSNELSGNIPSALGRLENLTGLGLDGNMLTGSIPASLGDLNKLTSLYLENNKLSGGIPGSLGNLSELKLLSVHNNEAMSGPLPNALTALTNLSNLRLDGTGLCVPRTDAFQIWLDGIETKQFEYCEADE